MYKVYGTNFLKTVMFYTKYQTAITSVGNFYMPRIGFSGILYCYLNKYAKKIKFMR